MSTITEIKAAIEKLSVEKQHRLAAWLRSRLSPEPPGDSKKVKTTRRLILPLVAALACLFCSASAQAQMARIVIDAEKTLGPVNRLVFGHNIEAADPHGIFSEKHAASNDGQGFWNPREKAFHPRVLAAAKAVQVGSLRYPGGCLAHNYNWKKAVGPLEARPDFQFGIDEYIALCRELNAEPVFTVSDYHGTAEEAAELVEYLNAPATPAHPWAMKRAEWGHAEPYGVIYFELGNESDHGNHKTIPAKKYSPSEYTEYVRAYAAAMRAVDPAIKLGVVTVPGSGQNIDNEWNRALFKDAAPLADFVVVHFYAPSMPNHSYASKVTEDIAPERRKLAHQAVLAVGEQLAARMAQYREAIREACGRDLPLAITEYNLAAVQETPLPYRFSYIAGMHAAEFLRVCLQPENHVLAAHYWHLVNGYWGVIRSRNGVITKTHAPYSFYKLWGGHLGSTLLAVEVDAPKAAFPGGDRVSPTTGERHQPSRLREKIKLPVPLLSRPVREETFSVANTPDGRGLVVELNNHKKDSYPRLLAIPATYPGDEYRISFEARAAIAGDGTDGLELGLGMSDPRGWEKYQSAIAVTGAEHTRGQWRAFSGRFTALPDAPGATVLARLLAKQPRTGTLEIRNLAIETWTRETFPAHSLLTSTATLSDDGRALHLIVLNKSLDQSIDASIDLRGFHPRSAAYAQIAGNPTDTDAQSEERGPVPVNAAPLSHVFPPCSMTAITFSR